MTIANAETHSSGHVRGAQGLFVFHSAVLASWVVVQLYYRVVVRFAAMDQVFWFGVMSWCLIAAAPFVILNFARGRQGTSATFAYLGVAFALADLLGETLQFAPQFGLPALMPSDKGMAELVVRSVWVSCEFSLRSVVFIALWRSQVGASKWVWQAFFGLVALHWVGSILLFFRATEAYAAWWSNVPVVPLFSRFGWVLALTWMSLLVWLNRRVTVGQEPALANAASAQ